MASATNIYTEILRQSKFNSSLCVSFPLSRIQSTCFASVFSSALTLTPFSRIFRCSQSNCAPAMADHPFFSLADARLCHLGHTPPLGMRHHHTMYQTSRLGHVTTWTVFIGKKRSVGFRWLAGLPYWSVLIHNSMNLTPQKIWIILVWTLIVLLGGWCCL